MHKARGHALANMLKDFSAIFRIFFAWNYEAIAQWMLIVDVEVLGPRLKVLSTNEMTYKAILLSAPTLSTQCLLYSYFRQLQTHALDKYNFQNVRAVCFGHCTSPFKAILALT